MLKQKGLCCRGCQASYVVFEGSAYACLFLVFETKHSYSHSIVFITLKHAFRNIWLLPCCPLQLL